MIDEGIYADLGRLHPGLYRLIFLLVRIAKEIAGRVDGDNEMTEVTVHHLAEIDLDLAQDVGRAFHCQGFLQH